MLWNVTHSLCDFWNGCKSKRIDVLGFCLLEGPRIRFLWSQEGFLASRFNHFIYDWKQALSFLVCTYFWQKYLGTTFWLHTSGNPFYVCEIGWSSWAASMVLRTAVWGKQITETICSMSPGHPEQTHENKKYFASRKLYCVSVLGQIKGHHF